MGSKLNTVRVPKKFEAIFLEAQNYVERYFASRSSRPEEGTIEIADERYLLVRAGSMSVDFFEMVRGMYPEDGGEEALSLARGLLFDIAHAMGLADAKVFAKKTGLTAPVDRLSAGPVHFAYTGWASVSIFEESDPVPNSDYNLIYDHPRSFECDSWLSSGQKTSFPVCIMNSGYSSGWCEASFDIPLVATEILCRAKGDEACRFVMAPPDRIEERIAEYLQTHPDMASKVTTYAIPGFFERKKREEALRVDNLDLERRIAERTEELRAINERLDLDLEEKRRTERELSVSRQFNEQVVEALPGGLLHLDLEGRIVSANSEACRFLGVTSEELVGTMLEDFSGRIVLEEHSRGDAGVEYVRKTLQTGEQHGPAILGMKRPDGTILWGVFNSVALRDAATITGAIITFLDITQQKIAEQESKKIEASLQEKQRLESLGILAGGIAHDFNNLLVGMLANARLARNRVAGEDAINDLLGRIEYAANQAAGLTEQMLAYAGKTRFELAPVDMSPSVSQMLDLLRASISSSITLSSEIEPGVLMVRGDKAQLSQVVLNLVTNAAESIESSGQVSVILRQRRLEEGALPAIDVGSPLSARNYILLEVRDTGCGMSPEVQAQMFEPFFSTKFSGRGLGLAALAGIVRSHKGGLQIDSELGKGTRVRLFLPELDSVVLPTAVPSASSERCWGKILVIEDNPIVAEAMEMMLLDSGYEVLVATTREQGLRMYTEHMIDLRAVVLDWTMPGGQGGEAIEKLQAVSPAIPIVVTTGYALDSVGHWGGVMLAKPFTESALVEKIAEAIERA